MKVLRANLTQVDEEEKTMQLLNNIFPEELVPRIVAGEQLIAQVAAQCESRYVELIGVFVILADCTFDTPFTSPIYLMSL